MGQMKKADRHAMWREDFGSIVEALATGGAGLEELIGTAMFSGLAVDIYLCSGEIDVIPGSPVRAKDPGWQWAVEHRLILVNMIRRLEGIVGFDVAGFKPFGWLALFVDFPGRWRVLLETKEFLHPDRLPAMPQADRLFMAAYLPSLLYAMIKAIANVPRLVGDLLPG